MIICNVVINMKTYCIHSLKLCPTFYHVISLQGSENNLFYRLLFSFFFFFGLIKWGALSKPQNNESDRIANQSPSIITPLMHWPRYSFGDGKVNKTYKQWKIFKTHKRRRNIDFGLLWHIGSVMKLLLFCRQNKINHFYSCTECHFSGSV